MSRSTASLFVLVIAAACLAAGGRAATLELPAALAGEDERESAPAPCLDEQAFTAGVASGALNLKVGGTAYGCDAEYAACFEFDLAAAFGSLPAAEEVTSATLIVRKTGYADDAQGFAYTAAFAYGATGGPVLVPRVDLTPETALDVMYPPVQNIDLEFNVLAAVQAALDDGEDLVGLLLAGVYPEAGFEDYITVGGAASGYPPRLVVEVTAEPVAVKAWIWAGIKAAYR